MTSESNPELTPAELDRLVELTSKYREDRIGDAEVAELDTMLAESPAALNTFVEIGMLVAELSHSPNVGPANNEYDSSQQDGTASRPWKFGVLFWAQLAVAATALITVGGIAYQLGKVDTTEGALSEPFVTVNRQTAPTEKMISGHATLRRVAGIKWSSDDNSYREGDVLPAGMLEFDDGVAEIDFFCGATVVIEGPAKLNLESDWSARLIAGRLRANVPPAARGFVIKAADSEIVDLGTEFALEVGPKNVHVAVVDGEIKLRGGAHDGKHLLTGEGQSLVGVNVGPDSFKNLSTISDVHRRQTGEQKVRFEQWKKYSQQLRADKRLIAYYPIAESKPDRFVPNLAATGHGLDGKIVGLVNHADGRFGSESTSLEFDRPGSRVRVRIDGEFNSFTFAGWVKIDSLEHLYNALFMGDGYENGEPHWQIHEDGRMMFSVMVDDTPGAGDGPAADARLHHIYYTQPIWDVSMSGKWLHLAAVYDPVAGHVKQYVNGKLVSSEEILGRFLVKTLRIGPAEIGNWGQPFRKSAEFAVRNLNGAIDELAIYNAALPSDEITALFCKEKPFGY